MRQIVLATKNQGKIREVKDELRDLEMEILTLENEDSLPDVLEDGDSFLENALKKAKAFSNVTGKTVLADDSGLEVDFLGGKPGVFSSRYSSPESSDEANIRKLMKDLKGIPETKRGARFRCVIVLYNPRGDYEVFEDTLEGRIALEPAGRNGFGYDPVFFVPDLNMTVAQMPPDMKNRISHRGKALRALKDRMKTMDKKKNEGGA